MSSARFFSKLTVVAGAAAVLLVWLAAGLVQPVEAQTKIRGGVAAYNEALLPVITAQEKGYFRDEKVEVELVNFKGGGPAVQAFVGGSVELCFCAADHAVRLRNRNLPTIILLGLDDRHSYALVGKAAAPYKSLADLKGRTLGITAPGSFTDNTLRHSIIELKLEPDQDFKIVGVGGGAPMQAAIDSGRIDAGMVILSEIEFMMQKQGVYRIVQDYRDMPYPSYAALALESWVDKNPEAARGFNRAMRKAMAELARDPALGVAMAKKMYPHYSDQLAAQAAKTAISRMPKNGLMDAGAIKNLNGIMLSADKSLKPVSVSDVVKPNL